MENINWLIEEYEGIKNRKKCTCANKYKKTVSETRESKLIQNSNEANLTQSNCGYVITDETAKTVKKNIPTTIIPTNTQDYITEMPYASQCQSAIQNTSNLNDVAFTQEEQPSTQQNNTCDCANTQSEIDENVIDFSNNNFDVEIIKFDEISDLFSGENSDESVSILDVLDIDNELFDEILYCNKDEEAIQSTSQNVNANNDAENTVGTNEHLYKILLEKKDEFIEVSKSKQEASEGANIIEDTNTNACTCGESSGIDSNTNINIIKFQEGNTAANVISQSETMQDSSRISINNCNIGSNYGNSSYESEIILIDKK